MVNEKKGNIKIRRILDDGEGYFSVTDIIKIFEESADAKECLYRIKKRKTEPVTGLSKIEEQLRILEEGC